DGDGQRESVVYIGWKRSNNQLVAWALDTKTGNTSGVLELGAAAKGISDLCDNRVADTYQSLNFFSITSGDFYGTGNEIALAALPFGKGSSKASDPRIVELLVSITSTGITISKNYTGYYWYLNQYFFDTDETDIVNSGDYEDLLSTQITSGDFNGDGIDDLAVLSYTNDISNTYDDEADKGLYTPYLAIGYGRKTDGLTDSPISTAWVYNNKSTSGKKSFYDIPIAGNITGADIDNDGCDEIVLAGYYGQVVNNDGEWYMVDSSRTSSKLICVTYDANSALSQKSWEKKDSNGWTGTTGETTTGVWLAQDYCWQPIGMGAARFDGIGVAEYVFISGSLFKFSSGKLVEDSFKMDYFQHMDNGNDSRTISVTFISAVTNGVFDGNHSNYEQIAFVVGLKASSTSTYHYIYGICGKREVEESGHTTRQFYCNNIEDSVTYSGTSYSASITAIDNDNDIVKVKYNSKSYGWSDPELLGVLQAAPYFGELGSYDDFDNGETSLTLFTSYETEDGESASQSLGVGAMFEVDAEVFEMEIKAGYSGAWSQTTFSSTSESQEIGVHADRYDTVILKRTPIFDFSYDIWDAANNKWEPGGYHINIVKESSIYQFSIDEYNTFARTYNAMMEEEHGDKFVNKFKEINEDNAPYLIDNEGNPFAYLNGTIDGHTGTLGHNGGSQSISYETSYGSGTSTSSESGFSFEFSACGGSENVKFGGYINSEFMWGHERTETEVSGSSTEGCVCNIDDRGIAAEIGSPESVVHQYGFT
ncbi:MAG: hypothetical protein IKN56_05545, partial [Clostridia bacterium]|nr:hypothetical protein [Clostridia bacterium]